MMLLRLLKTFLSSRLSTRTMRIIPIPANADNYQYLIVDEQTSCSAIVDPVDVDLIIKNVESDSANLTNLKHALVTHHHMDHAGGTKELKSRVGWISIYGGDGKRIEDIDKVVKEGQQFELGSLRVTALSTPCHTNTHVCYYVVDEQKDQKAVFTGDTLFVAGCGRFFEGTAEQMNYALNEKLAALPDDTMVYCGHEYTVQNLKFALSVEPNNIKAQQKLSWAQQQRVNGYFTIPSTIGEEKSYNPFMRVNIEEIQKKLNTLNEPIKTMSKLREMKNNFK